jgi:preprotein translocase subunit SecA
MNKQREVVYGLRNRVLRGDSMKEEMTGYLEDIAAGRVETHTEPEDPVSEDVIKLVAAELEMLLVAPAGAQALLGREVFVNEVTDHLIAAAVAAYERRENDWGEELTREVERRVMLSVIDEKWRDHLYEMDMLKEGIGLRAWGQKDPLIEYKREAYTAFEAMMQGLGEEIIRRFFRVSIIQGPGNDPRPPLAEPAGRARPPVQESHQAFSAFDEAKATATATSAPPAEREPVRAEKKVGRNDPCPCGSGKKYKKCHGR